MMTKAQFKRRGMILLIILLLFISVTYALKSEKGLLSTDKDKYTVGEKVSIDVKNEKLQQTRLRIVSKEKIYEYMDPPQSVFFITKTPSLHVLELYSHASRVDYLTFEVLPQEKPVQDTGNEQLLYIQKKQYNVGEKVFINIDFLAAGENHEVIINAPGNVYRYMGIYKSPIVFQPSKAGDYEINLRDNTGKVLDTTIFQARDEKEPEKKPSEPIKTNKSNTVQLQIKNSKGQLLDADVEVLRQNKPDEKFSILSIFRSEEETVDIEIKPKNNAFKSLKINKLQVNGQQELKYEQLSDERFKIKNAPTLKAYAIDPSQLNFQDAELTTTAEGNLLYKCKQYDFDGQTCHGEWEKIQNIIPGEEYSILIDEQDPAFVEVGLTSINTNESIYRPYEKAKILMVVLDNEGHLVPNAQVDMTVTNPNGIQTGFSTVSGSIIEQERGIYVAYYNRTTILGDYDMTVHALADNMNNSMDSYFTVAQNYEFDILRKTPVTTDPWLGPYSSEFTIISNTATESFDFTETLPESFIVTSAPGAQVTEQNGKTYITWQSITSGDTVAYSAQPPLRTPELFELRSFVTYSAMFNEARPWYLAIDPLYNQNFYASNTGSSGTVNNPGEADDVPDETEADMDLDDEASLWTYSFGLPSSGTLYNASLMINHIEDSVGTDDQLCARYRIGSAGTWNWLDGTAYTDPGNGNCQNTVPLSTNERTDKLPITATLTWSDIQDIQLGVIGNKIRGPDDTITNIDSIWLRIDWSPPPHPQNWEKNDSTVVQNESVRFNASWTDDTGLDSWIFAINQTGVWENRTTQSFGAGSQSAFAITINATPGTKVQWRFYANDTDGAWNSTPIQFFIVQSGPDVIPPTIFTVNITPKTGQSGQQFEINSTMTDNVGVEEAFAEVTDPTGTKTNYSMSNVVGNLWQYTYTGQIGGNYSVIVYAKDSNNTNVSDLRRYFNVTSYIVLDQTYYKRGDAVTIEGYGFSANQNVTLDVADGSQSSVSGFPKDVSTDSNGRFTSYWDIPNSLEFYLGNYSVTADDQQVSWLNDEENLTVVVKASTATLVDDNNPAGLNVKSQLNHSDNVTQRIRSSQNEDYIELTFPSMVPSGYNVDEIEFRLEHQELTADDLYIKWLNNSVWQTICTIPSNTGSEVFDSCDLSSYINDSNDANSLSLRISDDGQVGNNIEWTDIDFVYVYVNFSIGAETSITINEPSDLITTYDYSDTTNNKAWDGIHLSLPPPNIVQGAEATSAEYANMLTDDENYFQTTKTGNTNNHTYQSFKFKVTQSSSIINSFQITHDGHATRRTDDQADSYHFYIWNYTASAYQLLTTASANLNDQTTIITINDGFSDLKDGSGDVYILVEGNHINTGGTNAKSQIFTDLMTLDVRTRRTISGTQIVNVTAVDSDNITQCWYQVRNDSNVPVTQWITLNNTEGNLWINYSETTQFQDGNYYYYANCTDELGNSNADEFVYVTISNEAPYVFLVQPLNFANITVVNINFTWNVTDNLGGSPLCNLTINNVVNKTEVISNNGQNTTEQVNNFNDGEYNWSVSCINDAGTTNTSDLWYFTIDTILPTINLVTPSNNSWTNVNNVSLTYLPYDANGLRNCSLYLNGVFTQQNYTIQNNVNNDFNLTNQPDGLYNWQIYCTDYFDWTNFSETWYYYVDTVEPTINLLDPPNDAPLSNTSVQFNFTVIDALSANFSCNISVDDDVQESNFQVLNNSVMSRNLTVFDGTHNWSVTCWDNAVNYNTSLTWNFSVSAPPLVQIKSPANYTADIGNSTNLTYYVADGDGIQNCSLYLDGALNDTQYEAEIDNMQNNDFFVNFSEERIYNWTVQCFDNASTLGTTETWEILIDKTAPTPILFDPDPDAVFNNLTVNFNWTAVDNYLINLSCNLTVDNIVRDTFNIANNTNVSVNVTLGDGHHNWSVSCIDNATLIGQSELRNFTIRGPPTVNLVNPQNYTWQIGKNISFTYFVNDIDGIQNCSLILDGQQNQTNYTTEISNGANNNFLVNYVPENDHNWTVQCYDDLDFSNQPLPWIVRIDNTIPTINLHEPVDTDNLSNNRVDFNFTVRDNLSANTTCNVTINSTVYPGNDNIVAENNTLTYTNKTLGEGEWFWNVTCADFAGNTNTSQTYSFFIDAGPEINLTDPPDNAFKNGNFINFTYYVQDISGVQNCSLLLNDIPRKNETSINNNGYNDLNLSSVAEGFYNWSVQCYDNENNLGVSNKFSLTVDNTPPQITPHFPDDITLSSNDVTFNYTVIDNFNLNITCDLKIDDTVEAPGVNATNNSVTNTTVPGVPDGHHTWNVTCWDSAFNYGYSNTLNFSIDAAPDIFLVAPESGNATESGNVTFEYQVSDSSLDSCSLIINNQINQTDPAAQIPYQNFDGSNNFTLSNMGEGTYNWSVNCTDSNGFTGQANDGADPQFWLVYVDKTFPWVELNTPANGTNISSQIVTLNFTAYDTVDTNLTCDIKINGTVNVSNTWALNSTPRLVDINFSQSGTYNWNVSCRDDAYHYNYSNTRYFTIVSNPTIELLEPPNGSGVGFSATNLTFIVDDFEGISYCNVTVDGVNEDTLIEGTDFNTGEIAKYERTGLSQGQHSWSIACEDVDTSPNTVFSDTWIFYVDLNAPWIESHQPNNTLFTTSTIRFNWTANDAIDPLLSCDLYVNNTEKASNINSPNASVANATVSGFADGLFYWNVTCEDDAQRTNTSLILNFTVQEPPRVALTVPPNYTRTNEVNQTFYYIPYDNSDEVSSCNLLLDMVTRDSNDSININVTNNLSATDLTHGMYNWTVNCTDPSGNSAYNTSQFKLIIDLLGPTIDLIFPEEQGTYNYDDLNFTWNATDSFGTAINCNLTIDDQINQTGLNGVSGQLINKTVYNLDQGTHNWSVTCWDDLNNTNSSVTGNFTVNAPDLTLNNTHIDFNNTNPDENETITINATIYNVGGATANNIPVEFWDGLPGTGERINGIQYISSLPSGQDARVNVSWNISLGFHDIYVIINYTGVELSKDNNNATRNISVLYPVITNPKNQSWTNETEVEINFTLNDYTGNLINFSVYVDGSPNGQTGNSTDGVPELVNVTLTEGIHTIFIRAKDYLSREKDSNIITIYVDQTEPQGRFETPNQWWFNDASPQIFFNITDNLDLLLNYSLFVNDTLENSSTAPNATTIDINLTDRTNGSYLLTLNSTDEALNKNSTSIIIYIDTVLPTVSLLYPQDTADFTSTSVELNYSVDDNLDPVLACNLTVNNQPERTLISSPRNNVINTTVENLNEGTHNWNVTCWDGGLSNNINNVNTSETRSFNIFIAPVVSLIDPDDGNWSNQQTVVFSYNVTDDTGIENCSILINNEINQTNYTSEITNGAINNFTVKNLNGVFNWSVQCFDNTSFNMYARSENRTITVDIFDPEPFIETLNNTWFNVFNPLIRFNITDNLDLILDYTFYVNESANAQGTVNNATSDTDNLVNLQNGTYFVKLEGRDDAYNRKNTTPITIHVDTVEPTITLVSPENGNETTETNILFNFTASDNMASNFLCNLTVDNQNEGTFNVSGGYNSTILTMSAGTHYWNVTCVDLAGNVNTSNTFNFTIPLPDLTLNSSHIRFNTTRPQENKNITINATIYNIGDTDADNVTIRFYDGHYSQGNQINGDIIQNITAGQSVTVNVSWKVPRVGNIDVYVVVDPPIATGGNILEADENNNFAFNTIFVGSYNVVYGNFSGLLNIRDLTNRTIYGWNVTDYNSSRIFAVDVDSSVQWAELQAISRNLTNDFVFDDFNEIDVALQMENNSDSINDTWTFNNNARYTDNYLVYLEDITNVPNANSTNTTKFQTGILWDTSDGNTEYNGTQDLVFVTTVNVNQKGSLGTYDYEIKIPSNLKLYKQPNTATVALYTEIY